MFGDKTDEESAFKQTLHLTFLLPGIETGFGFWDENSTLFS